MSNDLTTRPRGLNITSMDDLARVADMFAKSGLFSDVREAAQAGVKIMAGAAWGVDPFTAVSGIYIVKNRPTLSAGLMAAAVKGHSRYDYRVRERTDKVCRIEFFEGAESLGVSEYTMKMAERAGLSGGDTWRKHPEAMLFARAMSSGVRTFCPDVFGVSTYTPEELGANVDDEGNIVDVPSRAERPVEARALPAAAPEPEPVVDAAPEPAEAVEDAAELATAAQLRKLAITLREQELTDRDQARAFLSWITDRELASSKELTKAEASRVIGWTPDQWESALADYAVAMVGGPPEPDWTGVPAGVTS